VHLAYYYAGVGAVLGVYSLNVPVTTAKPPLPAITASVPHYLDNQFSTRNNIERAILDARAAQQAIVVKALLSPDRPRLAGVPASNRIAAEMQTELKRLGCYSGRIDNTWGRASQRAMAKFNRAASLDLGKDGLDAKALAKLQGMTVGLCEAKADVRQQPVAPSHVTLSVNVDEKSKQKLNAVSKKDAPTSYLPPWMDGAGKTETSAGQNDTIQTQNRAEIRLKAKKTARKPVAVKTAERPRASFPKTSFSFAWPGQ